MIDESNDLDLGENEEQEENEPKGLTKPGGMFEEWLNNKPTDVILAANALFDPVHKPAHYNTGKIEVIEYIEDKQLNYNLGNAVKYISRAGKKDPTKYKEDIEKAIWYLNREIKHQI